MNTKKPQQHTDPKNTIPAIEEELSRRPKAEDVQQSFSAMMESAKHIPDHIPQQADSTKSVPSPFGFTTIIASYSRQLVPLTAVLVLILVVVGTTQIPETEAPIAIDEGQNDISVTAESSIDDILAELDTLFTEDDIDDESLAMLFADEVDALTEPFSF